MYCKLIEWVLKHTISTQNGWHVNGPLWTPSCTSPWNWSLSTKKDSSKIKFQKHTAYNKYTFTFL